MTPSVWPAHGRLTRVSAVLAQRVRHRAHRTVGRDRLIVAGLLFGTLLGTAMVAISRGPFLIPDGEPSSGTRIDSDVLDARTPRAVAGGYDISWAQCGKALPVHPAFAVVGVTRGIPFTTNPCLRSEVQWAKAANAPTGFYMNLSNPGPKGANWNTGGPKPCSGSGDDANCAYDYGWQAAAGALSAARLVSAAATASTWWLDVETGNTWSADPVLNTADIEGAVDYLHAHTTASTGVGVYSTAKQWFVLTGAAQLPSANNWVANALTADEASAWCGGAHSFSGGPVTLIQYPLSGFDGDVRC